MNLKELTIKQAHEFLENREVSSVELTKEFLKDIREKDEDIHAFLSLAEEEAIEQAKKVDERIAKGELVEILAGIPAAIKDNILIRGAKATAASKILENYIAPYDATVIKKLKEEEAVFIGKTNMDEFAMGSSTENSGFGPTKNPVDLKRVSGGSSGGSAAAVKAGFCVYALGSDTGGSIRQPASFCGVVGMKPTYGRVSRYGLVAFASSLDQIGPLTKDVTDTAILLNIISGHDPKDSTSVDRPVPDYRQALVDNVKKKKIGLIKNLLGKGIDPEVKKVIQDAADKLSNLGAEVVEVELPTFEYAVATYYFISPS